MSYEVWGEPDDDDRGFTEGRMEEMFSIGAAQMREMLARFVEQGGDATTANSIRLNWNPSWGKDPGRPVRIATDAWDADNIETVEAAHLAKEQEAQDAVLR
jgi:hypothetical protein